MVVPFPEVRRISVDDVKRRLDLGLRREPERGDPVVIVDVRSPEAFAAKHIAGALSVPLRAILDRTHELPRDREIVFY